MGVQTGAVGQLGQQMGVQDINTLLGIGGLQQQQGQKQLDVERANQLAQQALPFNKLVLCLISLEVYQHYNKLIQQPLLHLQIDHHRLGLGLGLGAGLGAIGIKGFGNLFGFGG